MNSVLQVRVALRMLWPICLRAATIFQACASLNYLIPHIENVNTKAEYWDVPTPVTDCLRETLTSESKIT